MMSKMSECAVTMSANLDQRDPASLHFPRSQPRLRPTLDAPYSPNPRLGLCFWGASTQERHLHQQGPTGEPIEHPGLCSMLHSCLDGRGLWVRMGYMFMWLSPLAIHLRLT